MLELPHPMKLLSLATAVLLRNGCESDVEGRPRGRGGSAAPSGYERGRASGYIYVGCLHDAGKPAATALYAEAVDKERQQPMTPRVCFDFCREMAGMQFFALTAGRSCYCTAYYERAPGEGVCTRGCEGESHFTCGGDGMMDVYGMHACHDEGEKLTEAYSKALEVETTVATDAALAATLAEAMELTANALTTVGVETGDAETSNYCQEAKSFAGELLHAGEAAHDATERLTARAEAAQSLIPKLRSRRGQSSATSEDKYDAELARRELHDLGVDAKASADALRPLLQAASRGADALDASSSRLFLPAASAVNLWAETPHPHGESVCAGSLSGDPVIGVTKTECAEACEDLRIEGEACVAFQYFRLHAAPGPQVQYPSLCLLLGSVDLVRTYTCPSECTHKDWTDRRGYDCSWYYAFGPGACSSSGTKDEQTAVDACCGCSDSAPEEGRGAKGTAACLVRFEWAHAEPFQPDLATHEKCFGD